MSQRTILNTIVSKLYTKLGKPVIQMEQTPAKPPYPFLSYKVISAYVQGLGGPYVENELITSSNPLFDYDVKETAVDNPTFTLSMTAYAVDAMGANELAVAAMKLFQHVLYYDLKDINAVIVAIEAVTDRTVFIVDHYEYRYGFDVRIRTLEQTDRIIETMEEITFIEGELNE